MSGGREESSNIEKILGIIRQGQALPRAAEQEFQQATEAIVAEYQYMIVRFCGDLLPSYARHQAEDIAQEIFTEVYQSLPEFHGEYAEASFKRWLYVIVRRTAYRELRRVRRDARRQQEMSGAARREERQRGTMRRVRAVPLSDRSNTPETLHERWGSLHIRQQALNRLTAHDRSLVRMCAQLPTHEVAEFFGITEDAVRKCLSRARERLKRLLDELSEGDEQ
jgi:RNA polymerase sigma-70 factor (ECF subfamily)